MPSLSAMTQEKGKMIEKVMNKTSVQMLHYTKLKPSLMNFYGQTDIEELADSLVLAGRILQPLIVRRTDIGEYEILAGHRRRNAAITNINRGMKEFEFLPCIVLSNSDLEQMGDVHGEDVEAYLKYILIATNSSARELTEYERMLQTIQLKEILPKMRGDENLKGRALRAEIAKETKKSTGAIGTYEAIWNHLTLDWMRLFQECKIGISVAAGIAGLDVCEQKELLQDKGENVTLKDVEAIKNKKKSETVSESDTETRRDSVITKWARIEANEKVCQKIMRLLCFDFPHVDELVSILQDGDYQKAHEYFRQYLPYKNSCIEIDDVCGYDIKLLVSEEITVVSRRIFWEQFKIHNIHKFPNVEQNVDDVEVVEDTAEDKPHDTSVYAPNPLSEHHEPLEGQLTTKDIGIEPDNDVVSESDTPLVITGPESNFEGVVDEMMEYVCDKLCKYPCELDHEALEDKCADCKMGGYVCKILNKVR